MRVQSLGQEGENGNPLQYSCLENPMDKGAWWAAVHSVAKSQTQLKRLSTHSIYSDYKILAAFPVLYNVLPS